MQVPALGLLDFGVTELLAVLLIYILLFGVDKLPNLARSVGEAQARLGAWKAEFDRELEMAQRGYDPELEQQREHHVMHHDPARMEEAQLREAAEAMGIATAGRPTEEVRADLRQRVDDVEATDDPTGDGGEAVDPGEAASPSTGEDDGAGPDDAEDADGSPTA